MVVAQRPATHSLLVGGGGAGTRLSTSPSSNLVIGGGVEFGQPNELLTGEDISGRGGRADFGPDELLMGKGIGYGSDSQLLGVGMEYGPENELLLANSPSRPHIDDDDDVMFRRVLDPNTVAVDDNNDNIGMFNGGGVEESDIKLQNLNQNGIQPLRDGYVQVQNENQDSPLVPMPECGMPVGGQRSNRKGSVAYSQECTEVRGKDWARSGYVVHV